MIFKKSEWLNFIGQYYHLQESLTSKRVEHSIYVVKFCEMEKPV